MLSLGEFQIADFLPGIIVVGSSDIGARARDRVGMRHVQSGWVCGMSRVANLCVGAVLERQFAAK